MGNLNVNSGVCAVCVCSSSASVFIFSHYIPNQITHAAINLRRAMLPAMLRKLLLLIEFRISLFFMHNNEIFHLLCLQSTENERKRGENKHIRINRDVCMDGKLGPFVRIARVCFQCTFGTFKFDCDACIYRFIMKSCIFLS